VLATQLIGDTCAKQEIQPGQLTIHAGNGSSMKSNPPAFLMADPRVTKTVLQTGSIEERRMFYPADRLIASRNARLRGFPVHAAILQIEC
jgi:hypothetical protein